MPTPAPYPTPRCLAACLTCKSARAPCAGVGVLLLSTSAFALNAALEATSRKLKTAIWRAGDERDKAVLSAVLRCAPRGTPAQRPFGHGAVGRKRLLSQDTLGGAEEEEEEEHMQGGSDKEARRKARRVSGTAQAGVQGSGGERGTKQAQAMWPRLPGPSSSSPPARVIVHDNPFGKAHGWAWACLAGRPLVVWATCVATAASPSRPRCALDVLFAHACRRRRYGEGFRAQPGLGRLRRHKVLALARPVCTCTWSDGCSTSVATGA